MRGISLCLKFILSFDIALSCPIVSDLLSIIASYNALIKRQAELVQSEVNVTETAILREELKT